MGRLGSRVSQSLMGWMSVMMGVEARKRSEMLGAGMKNGSVCNGRLRKMAEKLRKVEELLVWRCSSD